MNAGQTSPPLQYGEYALELALINIPIHGDGVVTDSDRQRSTTPDNGTHGALDRNLNEGRTGPAFILFEPLSPPTERRKSQMVVFAVLPLSETTALPLIDPSRPQFCFVFHARDYPRVGNSSEGGVQRTLTIICEKPLALNEQQARDIHALATENDVLVVEGLMYRSHPQIRKTKELLESGAIGDVQYIHGQFTDYNKLNPKNWRSNRSQGGGSMTAKGCYLVDACNYFSGSRAKAAFCMESINADLNVEVGETATIVYENGVTAQFETNHRSVWREELRVCGTNGTIVIPHAIVTKTQKRFIEIQRNGAYETRPMETERIEFEACNSYELQLINVYNHIKKGAELNLPIMDSVVNYTVTDALMKSVETGRLEPVLWDQ